MIQTAYLFATFKLPTRRKNREKEGKKDKEKRRKEKKYKIKMKATTFLLAICASLASAGVIITPITKDQVVPKVEGDCFFGVSTPTGCGPLRG